MRLAQRDFEACRTKLCGRSLLSFGEIFVTNFARANTYIFMYHLEKGELMDLRRLRYFVAVAEELHFGRAAERLGMSQPPLSRQIAQYEKELGAMLFNRSRSQVRLTPAGELLLARAVIILGEYDDTCLELKRMGQGASGRLRVGFVGSATYGPFPSIIKAYRAKCPEINLALRSMNAAELHRSLITREIDVAISRPSIDNDEIRNTTLFDEPLVLAVPDSLELAPDKPVALADLGEETFVLYPESPRPSFADYILKICAEADIFPKNRSYTMDYQTAISLVSVGVGLSIVPKSVAETKRNGVRFVDYVGPNPGTSLSVSYRLDNHDPVIAAFVDVAKKTIVLSKHRTP